MTDQRELTQEIPRPEWVEFFNRFSRQHDGWLVTVRVLDPELGAQVVVDDLPLRGITADLQDNEDRISINVGKAGADHATHIISNATRIRLNVDSQGAHRAVEFESSDAAPTLLQFRVSAAPETVDGVYAPS